LAATVTVRDQTASVIAVISRPEQADYIGSLGANEAVILSTGEMARKAVGRLPRSIGTTDIETGDRGGRDDHGDG
jgi:microcompartment protein CcmK/EutM